MLQHVAEHYDAIPKSYAHSRFFRATRMRHGFPLCSHCVLFGQEEASPQTPDFKVPHGNLENGHVHSSLATLKKRSPDQGKSTD